MSARSEHRLERRHEIQVKACELVLERGFAGFTMDDLADAVGCSRRTLFNHVPDKASAVIGVWEEHSGEDQGLGQPHVATFLAGGPTGELFEDAVRTIESLIRESSHTAIDHGRTQRLIESAIRADAKVNQLVGERLSRLCDLLATAICQREGWTPDDLRARALAASLFGLVLTALSDLASRGEGLDLAALFANTVSAERQARVCGVPA